MPKINGNFDFNTLFDYQKEIERLCQPLFKHLHFTYFHHLRMYQDDSHISLSNNAAWLEYFYVYLIDSADVTFQNNPEHWRMQIILWDYIAFGRVKRIYDEFREKFGIDTGFTLVKRYGDWIDFYHFGFPEGKRQELLYVINNLDLFEKFIFYYQDQSDKIIRNSIRNKTFLPDETNQLFSKVGCQPDAQKLQIKTMLDEKIVRYRCGEKIFTRREIEVLKLLVLGKSAAEIALILGNSKRTVEKHIYHLKLKLDCYKTTSLVTKAFQNGLLS